MELCSQQSASRVWIGLYKRLRALLHSGDVVRADHVDPASWLHGVVSPGREHAVYAYIRLATSVDASPARLLLPGLDPAARYQVTVCAEVSSSGPDWVNQPGWLHEPINVTGTTLARVGLPAPRLYPAQAVVFELRAVSAAAATRPG